MFECFHCGNRSVIWDSDYDAESMGYDWRGIVQMLHCTRCGAVIQYWIGEDNDG